MLPKITVPSPLVAALLAPALLATAACGGPVRNGFDLGNASIPTSEIQKGGPPRDGIPSIDDPAFIPAKAADFLRPRDTVIGLEVDGDARAYPLRILVWHEIVNDTVGGRPVAVTYCPLCGTAMTFDRQYGGKVLEFGVSGLLYQSDVLMYDRRTESLWSQLGLGAVSGPMRGTELKWVPSTQTTWADWREQHPETRVLSTDTGYRRDYDSDPYAGYDSRSGTLFPVPEHRDELSNKAWVAGVRIDGRAKAYPLEALPADAFTDRVGAKELRLQWHPDKRRLDVRTASGETVPVVHAFWFAWQAFYPETALWEKDGGGRE